MKCRTTFLLIAFAVATGAATASAQSQARPRAGSAAPARPAAAPARVGVATSAPPAQPIVVNTTGLPGYVVTAPPASSPAQPTHMHPAPVVQIVYYPTVVLSDGRVLANFGTGRGYEQVLRQCPQGIASLPYGAQVAPCWSVDAYGYYRVLQRP
jgi:hypothetical protein